MQSFANSRGSDSEKSSSVLIVSNEEYKQYLKEKDEECAGCRIF